MCSAIYSAGLRHGIYQYRYVTSMQRTELGQVVSGTEIVNSFNASMGIFLAKIDQVKSFLKSYNFSAISSLFESEKSLPEDYKKTGRYIKAVSDFYSAWHQLDYRKAFEIYPSWGESVRSQLVELGLADIIPTQDIYTWIEQLSNWKNYPENALKITYPTKDECIQKAHQATKIALDLLANGRRQIDMGNFEDARVRIYRIIEMIGQIYLFERGYDTARINPNDEKIKLFNHLNNNELVETDGVYSFHRTHTSYFIKKCFDRELGEYLLNIMDEDKENCIMGNKERNNSILIHGFSVKNQKDASKLKENFDRTEQVLKDVLSISQSDLLTAHKINSFRN